MGELKLKQETKLRSYFIYYKPKDTTETMTMELTAQSLVQARSIFNFIVPGCQILLVTDELIPMPLDKIKAMHTLTINDFNL